MSSKEKIAVKIKNIECLLEALKIRGATKDEINMFEMLLAKYRLDEVFLNGVEVES